MWIIYTSEPQHYNHLPNIVSVCHLLSKQPWTVEAAQDLWRCAVVSGTKTLAAISPRGGGLHGLFVPTDARLDWVLVNFEAKSIPLSRCRIVHVVAAFGIGQGSVWALWPFSGYAASFAANCISPCSDTFLSEPVWHFSSICATVACYQHVSMSLGQQWHWWQVHLLSFHRPLSGVTDHCRQ